MTTTGPTTTADGDGEVFCARHPNVETALRCSKCETPICPRCLVPTPVGARCPDCAQIRRIPTYNISREIYARAIGAAAVGGIVLGGVWAFLDPLTYGLLLAALAGLALGYGIGGLISFATGRRAGPPLQAIAVGGVLLAYVIRVGLLLSLTDFDPGDLRTDLAGLIVAGLAAFSAASRLR
jgi:hypothetical protein